MLGCCPTSPGKNVEVFVVEIPPHLRVCSAKPRILRKPSQKCRKRGRTSKFPRRTGKPLSTARHFARHSPVFHQQTPQRYRIKNAHRREEVWEIRWAPCWLQTHNAKMISNQCALVYARNVLTEEVKYFLTNRVPSRDGWTPRKTVRVAFGRWLIEDCFREEVVHKSVG